MSTNNTWWADAYGGDGSAENTLEFGNARKRLADPWGSLNTGDPWILPGPIALVWDGGGFVLHSGNTVARPSGDLEQRTTRELPVQMSQLVDLPADTVFPVELPSGPAGLSLDVLVEMVKTMAGGRGD